MYEDAVNSSEHRQRVKLSVGREYEYDGYKLIPTQRGKHLLMVNACTFSQMKQTNNYYCSKKSSQAKCRARVKLGENGKIITADCNHTHPPPHYVQTHSEYKIILNEKGKKLLLYNGYTYSPGGGQNYYCVKKNSKCRARIKLGQNGAIEKAVVDHVHDPPVYVQLSSGKYIKLKQSYNSSPLV